MTTGVKDIPNSILGQGNAVRATGVNKQLKRASDTEIATLIAKDLQKKYRNNVLGCEGEFWRYTGAQWEVIPQSEINRIVQRWDGVLFGKEYEPHAVNLSLAKIKSIIGCLAIEMQRDGFFDAPAAGINCLSGFIKVDPKTFKPHVVRHAADHRQRHQASDCARCKPGRPLGGPAA
jgi:hypothetical protein